MPARENDHPSTPSTMPSLLTRLAAASPAERAEIVLDLIEQHPEGRLDLPSSGELQVTLAEIDLSPSTLQGRMSQLNSSFPWWNAELRCVNLRGADLRGANLRKANLQNADLREANLQQAILAEANLRGAILEGANLRDVDLAGAHLQKAMLGKANLEGGLLEDANLEGAILRFAILRSAVLDNANLQGADLWGAVLTKAALANANLAGATLRESDLQGADLAGADLRAATLGAANLHRAKLTGANLHGASLSGADLREAVLRDAGLERVSLSDCKITHISLSGARLDKTQLLQDQLGGAIGEELTGDYGLARRGYLVLERNFHELGDADASSWAYRKRRRMQKLDAREQARTSVKEHRWRDAVSLYARFTTDQLVEWLCDYGESVPRVLGSLLLVYVLFVLTYTVTGSVVRVGHTSSGTSPQPTHQLIDTAIFSLLAMTTSGSPAVGLQPRNEMVHMLTGIQALLGIGLTALLGFVIGNRIRR